MSNDGYSCNYFVHAACAKLPRTFQHPSHPKHTVELRKLSYLELKICDVCKGSICRFLRYHCAQCDFDAHLASIQGEVGQEDSNPPEQASKDETQRRSKESGIHLSTWVSLWSNIWHTWNRKINNKHSCMHFNSIQPDRALRSW